MGILLYGGGFDERGRWRIASEILFLLLGLIVLCVPLEDTSIHAKAAEHGVVHSLRSKGSTDLDATLSTTKYHRQ